MSAGVLKPRREARGNDPGQSEIAVRSRNIMADTSSSLYLDSVQCHSQDVVRWKENQRTDFVSWQTGVRARFGVLF